MPEQQGDSSEPSRNPSTDKQKLQSSTNMDWKFQETMQMPNILMSNGNTKWKDAIDLDIEQIKE